jgi:hypothetical protein
VENRRIGGATTPIRRGNETKKKLKERRRSGAMQCNPIRNIITMIME